jgi:hypothetical protein
MAVSPRFLFLGGAALVAAVLGGGFLVRGAGFVQGDGDGLARVLHLRARAGLELAVLELVHHALDDLFLTLRLLGQGVVSRRCSPDAP